jgi:general stress protein 26
MILKLQIRIEGKAELITDKEQIATYWHGTAGI